MKPTLSYEMHTIYTGAIYLKAVMAFHIKESYKIMRWYIGMVSKLVLCSDIYSLNASVSSLFNTILSVFWPALSPDARTFKHFRRFNNQYN